MKITKTEKAEAVASLRKTLKSGTTVYTVLRGCARSGMTRWMDVFVIRKNEPLRLTWSVAKALGWTYSKRHDALEVSGCGMDMGFYTIHSLFHCLHGYAGEKSGYTLNHRWL